MSISLLPSLFGGEDDEVAPDCHIESIDGKRLETTNVVSNPQPSIGKDENTREASLRVSKSTNEMFQGQEQPIIHVSAVIKSK